jgi:hypothetical protein
MKPTYILLLLLSLQHICNAQYDKANKRDSVKILNADLRYYDLTSNSNEHSSIRLPYDTVEFIDARYDTTFMFLEFPLLRISNTYNVKGNLDSGFANNISRYFNKYYSTVNNHNNTSLICYIKKFAVTLQYDFLEHFNSGNLHDDTANQINIEIECYYKHGDKIFPATRFDTSYAHHFPNVIFNASPIIKELLRPFMEKIEHIDLERVVKRKIYTQDDITKRYNARFDIPILKTTSYKRGVYKNFNEFRNNIPSIDSFNISTELLKVKAGNVKSIDAGSLLIKAIQKRNTITYLYDKNNQLITPSEVFGYCDGKTAWIQHGSFFYPLIKTGNAFEFMFIYHYANSDGTTYTAYILTPLNMETGHSN